MCDTCLSYRVGNLAEEEWNSHMALKQMAQDAKEFDKTMSPASTAVFTEDTEALLIAPHNRSSAMFYRTKLNVHNLSYFNLKNKEVMNYIWTEVSAGLPASVFTSIHIDHLKICVEQNPDIEVVIVWSDGCLYQNKNACEASALRRFASKYNIVLIFKYLQVGHTFMESDSVHRCIENKIKNQDINVPQDYISIIKHARERPFPYKVRFNSLLPHTFFLDYESNQDIRSIRPGTKVNDPTVVDIKQLKFTHDGTIAYKLSHDEVEEYQVLPAMRRLGKPTDPEYKQLYEDPRAITAKKWKHLQELKCTIPSFFHLYYDDLPHTRASDPTDANSTEGHTDADPTAAKKNGMADEGCKENVKTRKIRVKAGKSDGGGKGILKNDKTEERGKIKRGVKAGKSEE